MKAGQYVKELVTGPGGTTRIVGSALVAATILTQHYSPDFMRLQNKDTLSFLPNWRFFAPRPATHDHCLVYRVLSRDGETTPWKSISTIPERKVIHILWYANRRSEKSVFDTINEILHFMSQGFSFVTQLPGYRMLSSYIMKRYVLEKHSDAQGFQFAVIRSPGYDETAEPSIMFVSPYIPMGKEQALPGRQDYAGNKQ
ncbi:hypothetical protein [Streptomyces sp. CT34]|uniref:hypothetical protein n=1 Tax=Streptomyces sp. CT34 TaxID=1553907 RepID=UPI0007C7C675|nr:hypothetical protein [Streptomyces sp. CT34]